MRQQAGLIGCKPPTRLQTLANFFNRQRAQADDFATRYHGGEKSLGAFGCNKQNNPGWWLLQRFQKGILGADVRFFEAQ